MHLCERFFPPLVIYNIFLDSCDIAVTFNAEYLSHSSSSMGLKVYKFLISDYTEIC